jgi:hypothetical protein
VIITLPAATPVSVPDVGTVNTAIAVFELDHVPPVTVPARSVVVPLQKDVLPLMPGVPFTVTTDVVAQPVGNTYEM